jgi:hypothetical protein
MDIYINVNKIGLEMVKFECFGAILACVKVQNFCPFLRTKVARKVGSDHFLSENFEGDERKFVKNVQNAHFFWPIAHF